jgi:heme o synthase
MFMYSRIEKLNIGALVLDRARDYMTLVKFRLTFLVAFSSAFGYLLGSRGYFDWVHFIMFSIGGFLISGSSVTINQIMEREYDKLMTRTKNRPLPASRISINEALIYAGILSISGFAILAIYSSLLVTAIALFSMIMYCFVYTPLKRVGPIAVFMGAIPGALPPLLGWIAATGAISYEAVIIFSIQFIWQFPHFWAIAWIADDDYKRAGFKLLPGDGKKDINTAIQIMIYALFLIPLGLLPAKIGLTGINSAMVAVICGALFLGTTFSLMKEGSRKAALKIMYGSFLYLPIVQIAFVLDKT